MPAHLSLKKISKKNWVQLILGADSSTLQDTFPLFIALSQACRSQPDDPSRQLSGSIIGSVVFGDGLNDVTM